ncbi:beta strand repeat-containing protein [Limnoglobus roseus]|uniref:Bacterial Ig-like domain-containing protein n=1 Tax=Limnoglobus roseus TaxID=2598579 RepID=A0A5C1APA5_9BACT|nr:Ig-like domain-containing protein [Limnoglobus roseus]QEL19582.1 hypothetical protein PX52LOC_06658 [Limnoglobus roseus]
MFPAFWKKRVLKQLTTAAKKAKPTGLRCESLEDRLTPAAQQLIASAVEFGVAPTVSVFDAATRQLKFTVPAYESTFTGGVRVAIGDVDGDGVEDLITGAGRGGGPVVSVFSGADGSLIRTFFAGDDTNRGGVTVAAADFDGDGLADVVVGAVKNGVEIIQVLRGTDGAVLKEFRPFDAAIEGVNIATGDYNGDGTPDVVIGAGVGGGPRVTVVDGKTSEILLNTFAFEPSFRGGMQVAAGDLDGDGRAEVIAAAGPAGGPRIVSFAGGTGVQTHSFFAYDNTNARNGVQVSVFDVDRNGTNDIVTADGPGQAPNLRAFDGISLARLDISSFPGLPFGSVVVFGPGPIDTTTPSAVVNTTATSPTNVNPIPFTIAFSEDVSPLTVAGLSVTNGTVTALASTDARTYTVSVTPTGQGSVAVSVLAGAVADAAGNPNTASNSASVVFDSVAPVATLATTAADPTNLVSIPVSVTFSEGVSDLDSSTIAVTNGTLSNFVAVDGRTFTFDVTPTVDGLVAIDLAAGAVMDAAGNASAAASLTITSDRTAPSVVVETTAGDSTGVNPIPFTITFDETVRGFTATGVSVVNGAVLNFVAADAQHYTFDVVPAGTGDVIVSVAAGVAIDAAGNANTISNDVTVTFTGTVVAPTISTTASDTTNLTPIPVTVTFSDDVTDFDVSDLVVTNGTASNFVAVDARTYTFDVTPVTDGLVTVAVPPGAALDSAGAPTAAGTFSITSDTTAPVPVVSTTASTVNNLATIGFTVTFNEDVTGFSDDAIVVTNGTTSNFVAVDARTYTFDVTPTADGPVTVSVTGGTAFDTAGNASTASADVTVTSDRTAPTATLSTTAADPTNASPISFTVTFDEDVVGFNNSGTTVTNGAVSNFVVVDARTYTFDVTPTADGLVTVDIAAGVAFDAAGNGNVTASFALTFDTTGPVPTLSTTAPAATNAGLLSFTITFDEDVVGFDETGLDVTNGTVSGFVAVDGRTFTFDVSPTAEGDVTVSVLPGVISDALGNPNPASNVVTVVYDVTAPTPTLSTTATDPSNTATISFTVTFDEGVTGFDETGLTVTNGTVSNFVAVDAQTYTFDVTPTTDGLVTIDIAAGVAFDSAGNASNAVTTYTIVSDQAAPTVTIDPTSTGGITGTASDGPGTGVTGIEVSVQDVNGSGLFWDETTQDFTSSVELFYAATDTSGLADWSTWAYSLPAGVTGDFQVHARGSDAAGNPGEESALVTVS